MSMALRLTLSLCCAFLILICLSHQSVVKFLYNFGEAKIFNRPVFDAQKMLMRNERKQADLIVIGQTNFISLVKEEPNCFSSRLDITSNIPFGWRDLSDISKFLNELNPKVVLIQLRPDLRTNNRQTWPRQKFDSYAIFINDVPMVSMANARWSAEAIIKILQASFIDSRNRALKPPYWPDVSDNAITEYSPRAKPAINSLKKLKKEGAFVAWLYTEALAEQIVGSKILKELDSSPLDKSLPGVVSTTIPSRLSTCLQLDEVGELETYVAAKSRFLASKRAWGESSDSKEIWSEQSDLLGKDIEDYLALLRFITELGFTIGDPAELARKSPTERRLYLRYDVHQRDLYSLPAYLAANETIGAHSISFLQWNDSLRDGLIEKSEPILLDWFSHPLHKVGLHAGPIHAINTNDNFLPTRNRLALSEVPDVIPSRAEMERIRSIVNGHTLRIWKSFKKVFADAELLSVHGSSWNQKVKKKCQNSQTCVLKALREGSVLSQENLAVVDNPMVVDDISSMNGVQVKGLTDTGGDIQLICRLVELEPSVAAIVLLHPARIIREKSNYKSAIAHYKERGCVM